MLQSVKLRILAGFLLVTIPLAIFLYYSNYYAINIVRDQISKNHSNLLDLYTKNTDNVLYQTNLFLYGMLNDQDVSIINAYVSDSNEYMLTKLRIINKLNITIGYYEMVDSIFVYLRKNNDLILSTQKNTYQEREVIYDNIDTLLTSAEEPPDKEWRVVETADGYAMYKMIAVNANVFIGSWISVENLMEPISNWELGEDGGVMLLSGDQSIGGIGSSADRYSMMDVKEGEANKDYRIVTDRDNGSDYLIVEEQSLMANIKYAIIVAEKSILRNLPYFQQFIYMIPLVVVIILVLYFVFLQRTLIKPLFELVRGMRRIGQGRLDVRLHEGGTGEFRFLNTTFNEMAREIEHLKINVYEEKLKVQDAEFKHLQVQINPHFYMNTLNIIYNLAALKDFKSVQKMSLHLADYFRFIIRTNRTKVTLEEELQHIKNYLEIQHLRYPDLLLYNLEISKELQGVLIPPLIVQPFVENSIIHGFQNRREPFVIHVQATQDEADSDHVMKVTIQDNGKGFADELMARLNAKEYVESNSDEHVGIWNVWRRLRMDMGDEVQISFANAEPHGAIVTIRIPLLTERSEVKADVQALGSGR